MQLSELKEKVLNFAKEKNEPFTTEMAFDDIKDADDRASVSQAARFLFLDSKLVRKKIDGLRYSYALPENATDDYESALSSENNPKKQRRNDPPVIVDEAIKPPVAVVIEEHSEIPTPKVSKESAAENDDVIKTSPQPSIPLKKDVITDESHSIDLPANFRLTLNAPNGLRITIESGFNEA